MSATLLYRFVKHRSTICNCNHRFIQKSLLNNNLQQQRIVIALGGNAIQNSKEKGTAEEMMNNIDIAADQMSSLLEDNNRKLIITHGNGPQIGSIYLQNQTSSDITPCLPLYLCGAFSQGSIGFMLQRALQNRLFGYNVTALVTQVIVSKNDKAWNNPTKPIGKYYNNKEAYRMKLDNKNKQFVMMEDRARGGYRICVASPKPLDIVPSDKNIIQQLVNNEMSNNIVITCGGGGIPVIIENDKLYPMDNAVIDKDLTAVQLASAVDADYLIIATDIDAVYLNYDVCDNEHDTTQMIEPIKLGKISVGEIRTHYDEGHFGKGSMGPKILAAIQFVELTNKICIICSLSDIQSAMHGEVGTMIVPNI